MNTEVPFALKPKAADSPRATRPICGWARQRAKMWSQTEQVDRVAASEAAGRWSFIALLRQKPQSIEQLRHTRLTRYIAW